MFPEVGFDILVGGTNHLAPFTKTTPDRQIMNHFSLKSSVDPVRLNPIGRLASAIGYPQVVPADAVEFSFKVDDLEIDAIDLESRLVLLCEISRNEEDFSRLATYAAGRILRDDAIVYWDERREAAMLSQEITSSASPVGFKNFFEAFAGSCDWWSARTAAKPLESSSFPEMVIRP